ncbi:hypothetical protein [Falsiroseomonas selenitidurans]|uniref:Uncharacterized protein n=1 Tax=Falsiroseomonas selenitidurans TaxID=2716335 RepID=A0ABX1E5M7_9PROT|nr:hypothetical protein [Falsiroseomonas selenitidurans]NKC32083.1 hypothetical protein [Falsiroseomonas selenitidurans]
MITTRPVYRFNFTGAAVAEEAAVTFYQGRDVVLHVRMRRAAEGLVLLVNDWRSGAGAGSGWGRVVSLPLPGAAAPLVVAVLRGAGRVELEVEGHGRLGFARLPGLAAVSAPVHDAAFISLLPAEPPPPLPRHCASFLFQDKAIELGQAVTFQGEGGVLLHLDLRPDPELGPGQLALVVNDAPQGVWGEELRLGLRETPGMAGIAVSLHEGPAGMILGVPDGRCLVFPRLASLAGADPPRVPSGVTLLPHGLA